MPDIDSLQTTTYPTQTWEVIHNIINADQSGYEPSSTLLATIATAISGQPELSPITIKISYDDLEVVLRAYENSGLDPASV